MSCKTYLKNNNKRYYKNIEPISVLRKVKNFNGYVLKHPNGRMWQIKQCILRSTIFLLSYFF